MAAWPPSAGGSWCWPLWATAGRLSSEWARARTRTALFSFSIVGLHNLQLHPIHTSLATCCRLLSDPASALYDLAVIYYGASPSFSCAACAHTWARRGLKWQLVRALAFSPEWEALAAGYQYIMLVWRA